MTTHNEPHGITFIGCCRRCKLSRRFRSEVLRVRHGNAGYGRKTWTREHSVVAAAPFVGSDRPEMASEYHDRAGKLWLKCPAGHSVEFKALRGITTDKKCDARCLSATGNCCECSCGGKNHGGNHAA